MRRTPTLARLVVVPAALLAILVTAAPSEGFWLFHRHHRPWHHGGYYASASSQSIWAPMAGWLMHTQVPRLVHYILPTRQDQQTAPPPQPPTRIDISPSVTGKIQALGQQIDDLSAGSEKHPSNLNSLLQRVNKNVAALQPQFRKGLQKIDMLEMKKKDAGSKKGPLTAPGLGGMITRPGG